MANIAGHTGLLKLDGLPVVCLTSTSYSLTSDTVEKVNYCTNGEPVTTVRDVSEEVQIEGEIMGGTDALVEESYATLLSTMEAKLPVAWTLEGRGTPIEFNAIITSLSDSFTAGEDATFSATLRIIPTV